VIFEFDHFLYLAIDNQKSPNLYMQRLGRYIVRLKMRLKEQRRVSLSLTLSLQLYSCELHCFLQFYQA